MGMKFWLWRNFVGYVMFVGYDFGYVRIYLLYMDMQEIFVGYLGRVGILIVHGYEKKSVVVYGHVKNFDCGEIFGGALTFLALNFFFGM